MFNPFLPLLALLFRINKGIQVNGINKLDNTITYNKNNNTNSNNNNNNNNHYYNNNNNNNKYSYTQ